MRWNHIGRMPCSIARTLEVVGERWTMLVLREAFGGAHRFEEFQRSLGVARNVLATRLAALVRHGILGRALYQERPRRFEYRLTEKGFDLYPVVVAMMRWGDRWVAGADGPPLVLIHKACEHDIAPALTCGHCGAAIGARDVRAVVGPGLMNLGRPRGKRESREVRGRRATRRGSGRGRRSVAP